MIAARGLAIRLESGGTKCRAWGPGFLPYRLEVRGKHTAYLLEVVGRLQRRLWHYLPLTAWLPG